MKLAWCALAVSLSSTASAGTTYVPGHGELGAVLFEDLWPQHGDGDYNDVVVRYNARLTDDGAAHVTSLTLTLQVQALGASECNGVAIALPTTVAASPRLSIGEATPTGAPWTEIALPDVSSAPGATVFWLVDDLRAGLCGGAEGFLNTDPTVDAVACRPLTLDLDFGADSGLTGDAPWDLFVHRCGDRGHQIHRPGFPGTPEATAGLFGTGADDPLAPYTHGPGAFAGLPWVLVIGETLPAHPREHAPIETAWPTILTFAANPTQGTDYYADAAVVPAKLYTGGAHGTALPGPVSVPLAAADADADGFCVGWDHDADPLTPDECSTAATGDCNDAQGAISPAAVEACDLVDNDCDDDVDEPGATGETRFYADSDGDLYGTPASYLDRCAQPAGHVANASDCNDGSSAIKPGATEIWYDGTDQNCDGANDFDKDGDGQMKWPTKTTAQGGRDCNDDSASVLWCGKSSDTALATCSAIYAAIPEWVNQSGNFWVNPPGHAAFEVYCDMASASAGWTLIAQGGATKCGTNFTQKSSMRNTDTCGYLSDARVRALAGQATTVRLQVGTSTTNFGDWTTGVTSTNGLAISALQGGGNWHNGATFSGWSFGGITCSPTWASSWPNMFHACGNGGGVHWLIVPGVGYAHDWVGAGTGKVSATWVR